MTPIISIEHISKRFPGVVALNDVSIDILGGELHAIVGENGAGKSTLMKILSGVIPAFEGQLLLRGRPVRFSGTRAAEQRRFFFLDDSAMERAARDLLVKLECHIDPGALVRTLRVGDQQLVEIAKALSLETEILIMDEPTSALTEAEVARLFRVIARLRERGVTILYISHKMDEVFRLADRITVLRDGKLVKTVKRDETNPRQITHLMVGREIEAVDLGGARQTGAVVLAVDGLSLRWAGHARAWRLKDISFQLRRGEILGIAGLMGAGRTELLECLFGSSPEPPLGRIMLDGRAVRFTHPAEATRAGISLVTEDRKRLGLFAQMTVGQNITICTLNKATRAGLLNRKHERRLAGGMVEKLAIKTAGIGSMITNLSGGNQQKAIIGRWLLTKPKVLLLDDPTKGIDLETKRDLYVILDDLCTQGVSILLYSSDDEELLGVSDRVLVFDSGRVVAELVGEQRTQRALYRAAYARDRGHAA